MKGVTDHESPVDYRQHDTQAGRRRMGPFSVIAGTDAATVLAAADYVQTEFLNQQPGFLRRELLKGSANQ